MPHRLAIEQRMHGTRQRRALHEIVDLQEGGDEADMVGGLQDSVERGRTHGGLLHLLSEVGDERSGGDAGGMEEVWADWSLEWSRLKCVELVRQLAEIMDYRGT